MNNKVSVGNTSVIGWTGALLALLPTIIKAVESGTSAISGPDKYLAVTGIVLGAITQIGRYLQAHKLIGLNVTSDIEKFEKDVNLPIESAVKAEGPLATQPGSVVSG